MSSVLAVGLRLWIYHESTIQRTPYTLQYIISSRTQNVFVDRIAWRHCTDLHCKWYHNTPKRFCRSTKKVLSANIKVILLKYQRYRFGFFFFFCFMIIPNERVEHQHVFYIIIKCLVFFFYSSKLLDILFIYIYSTPYITLKTWQYFEFFVLFFARTLQSCDVVSLWTKTDYEL